MHGEVLCDEEEQQSTEVLERVEHDTVEPVSRREFVPVVFLFLG